MQLSVYYCIVYAITLLPPQAVFFNNYIRDPDRPMPEESTISSSVLPSIPKTPGSAESPLGGVMALGSGGSPWDQGRMGMFGRGQWCALGPSVD